MPSSRVVLDAVAHGQLRLKDLAAAIDVTPQRVRQLIELDGFPKPVRISVGADFGTQPTSRRGRSG